MKLLNLLYELKSNKVNIWKNNNGNLLFTFNTRTGFPKYLKNSLIQYKAELLEILIFNTIDSEAKSKSTAFYKIPESFMDNTLSQFQSGVYIQNKLDIAKYTYNVPMFIYLKEVDIEILKNALVYFLTKHPIFRMGVYEDLKYKILDIKEFGIKEYDIDATEEETICENIARNHEFNLNGGKLVNIEIIKIKNCNDYLLNLTHHHILIDHYSLWLIASEILLAYVKLYNGEELNFSISPLDRPINYFDYIVYQNYKLQTKSYKDAIEVLSNKLANAESLQLKKTNLIFDNQGERFDFKLDINIYKKLKQIALDNDVSLYSILLTSLYHVLSIYSGNQVNFPIGLTISNRPIELSNIIGPFISTLPMIPEYNIKDNFIDNIRRVYKEIIFLNEYQQINLNTLTKKLKDSNRVIGDLLHVVFTMHNYKQELQGVSQVQFRIIKQKEIAEKFGINIGAKENNKGLLFHISYAKSLYNKNYIEAIFNSFVSLLSIMDNILLTVQTRKINLLNKENYNQVLNIWNQTDKDYPNDKTICKLFEEQVKKLPDSIAVVFDNIQLTYRELNKMVNQLANYLRNTYTIKSDDLLGIILDRNINFLVSILAVFKIGIAYIPIDPAIPDNRIKSIIKESKPKFLLTEKKYMLFTDKFNEFIINRCCFEEIFLHQSNDANFYTPCFLNSLSYVIYTSGSTGKPKGAMIEYNGMYNHLRSKIEDLNLTKKDIIAQVATQSFDVSVWQFIIALIVGGKTIIFKEEESWQSKPLLRLIYREKVTIFQTVPIHMSSLIEELSNNFNKLNYSLIKLRWLIMNGEALSSQICIDWFVLYPNIPIINTYGSTECSDDISHLKIFNNKNLSTIIPLNKPSLNSKIYILNSSLNLLPIGAVGEIYIGGIGVGRGYLNRPELTAERFIANPFQTKEEWQLAKNSRLYKTGDLARWLPDGNLEYVGRDDFQVKIRGHRIELEEIESVLRSYKGIKQGVVLAKEYNNTAGKLDNKYLVGYYVSEVKLNEEDILNYLQTRLPDYMIPSVLSHLESLPLMINGKLDRKSLPEIEFGNNNYVAPRNKLEKQVCNIWSNILGVPIEQVGIRDNFFRLGGNSLLAIKLTNKLNQELNSSISVSVIFKHNTVDKFIYYLQDNNRNNKNVREYEF